LLQYFVTFRSTFVCDELHQTWFNNTSNISTKLQLLLQSVNYSYNFEYMLNHGGQLQLLLKEINYITITVTAELKTM